MRESRSSCSSTSTSRTSRTRRRRDSPPTTPYDGEVAYADEIVGRLFDRLRALDLYDRATIVLLSDHGEGLGDHGEQEHGLFLYQETIRIPLIVKLPGGTAARRVAAPVQQIDIAPDDPRPGRRAEAGRRVRGRSLKPLLDGTGTIADTGHLRRSALLRATTSGGASCIR